MNERFLSMFFDEARELLQGLETGLMELEARQSDRAHVDRTFRAAHTLKGAAGMVGLRAIADFTHAMESVLDRVRSGQLAVTADLITTLLAARDHLEAAVDAEAEGRRLEPPADLLARLAEPGSGARTPAAAEPAAAEPPPAASRAEEAGTSRTYRITLSPGRDLFRKGIDPLGFLDELRELGQARVELDPGRVPPLSELDPTDCHLAWTIELRTEAGREQVDEVFLFLDDPAQVTIEPLDDPAPAVAEAPAPEVATATAPVPAPPATEGEAGPKPVRAARVRVDAEQLDQLVGMAGELAVLTDSLQALGNAPGSDRWSGLLEALERLGRRLRETTLELRMVPIEELFVRFPRVVRDLAERSGKRIDLRIEGADTQLDRTIIERLVEPMIHLIRNAVDHGLEPPEARQAAGKPPTGRITISAGHEGDRVAIRVVDDGRGLDRQKILRKGEALGLLPPETPVDDPRVGNLIFEPGFSTRDQAGELSGRGVGLDVVRDAIRALRGTIALRSAEGKGTTFLIHLPLTLAMIDGLLVEAVGDRFVVPIGQVEECVSLGPDESISTMGHPAAVVRGELVPIVTLRGPFDAGDGASSGRRELLLTRFAERRAGVMVDRLLGRVQAVIQPLDPALGRALGRFSGATILGDGSVCLILDLSTVIAEAHTSGLRPALSHVP